MGTDRIRVRAPIAVAGVLILIAMLGQFCGVALALAADSLMTLLFRIAYETGATWNIVAIGQTTLLVLFVGTPTSIIVLILTGCQRWRVVLGGAALLGITMTLGAAITSLLLEPYTPVTAVPSSRFWSALRELGVVLVVLPILVIVLAAILRTVFRFVAYRVIEQDGTLCGRCGYRLVDPTTARCPECGTDDPTRIFRPPSVTRFARAVARRRALWSAVVVGLFLGAITWIAALEAPFVQFRRTFGAWGDGQLIMMEQPPGSPWVWALRREFPVDADLFLSVNLNRASSTSSLRLWVRLGQTDVGTASMVAPVALELRGDERDRVLRDGVPEATIERMRAAHAARAAPTEVLWLDGGLVD